MTNTDRPTVINTPEGIAFAQFLAVRSMLRLEVTIGMKMSRGISSLKIANRVCGTSFKRKADALAHMNGILAEFDARA